MTEPANPSSVPMPSGYLTPDSPNVNPNQRTSSTGSVAGQQPLSPPSEYPRAIRNEHLDGLFQYQQPTSEQAAAHQVLHEAAKVFAAAILAQTPSGADQAAAIRKVREAVMTANGSFYSGV